MHFIPDIYYSPVSMDFPLNWVNGAKRKYYIEWTELKNFQ